MRLGEDAPFANRNRKINNVSLDNLKKNTLKQEETEEANKVI